jgi:hypothetical protein
MSMSLRGKQCPVCEEWYADWATRCPICGVALVRPETPEDADDGDAAEVDLEIDLSAFAGDAPPARAPRPDDFDVLTLPEEEQLVYELAEWSLTMRSEVAAALADAGIPHAWERTDLIIHTDDEPEVDRICEVVEAEHGVSTYVTATDAADVDDSVDGAEDAEDAEEETASIEEALGTDDLLEYDLEPWKSGLRRALFDRLELSGIAYRRDGEALVVRAEDETLVETAIDAVTNPDIVTEDELEADLADESDDADEDSSYVAMSNLFLAADRLRHGADNREGTRLVAESIEELDPDAPPFGVSPTAWAQVVTAAEELADAISGDQADDDAVIACAKDLRAILRPLI